MTDRKLRPTSFDYALAALSPVLIILMIGSLVYFLLTTLYRGDFQARLMWILGLFTMASVLITRIAIEQSRTQSFTYLGLLSAATLLVAPRFFVLEGFLSPLSIPILIGFLALIVFLADRITMDCTSVDDAHDSHGYGLLQSLGIFKRNDDQEPVIPRQRPTQASDTPESSDKESRSHNPGVWILYFALLALPVFGLGQFFLPSGQAQRVALACLVIYLGSALALLVMISLLALRQYVRQRDVEMQTRMSWNWLATGIGSVLGLVLLMAILPLPMLGASNWELPFKLSSRTDQTPSQWGWGNEGVKQQPQQQQPQQQQPQQQQPQQQQPQQQQPQQQQPQQQQPQQQQPQQQQPQQQQPQQQQPQQQQPQQQQPPNTWSPPKIDWNLGASMRWLLIAILALVALVFGAKYLRQWLAWFHRDGSESFEPTELDSSIPIQANRPIRFSELEDPFKLHRNEPDEIIRSLFHAVSVWGKEHRVARAEDETPDEYSRRLGRKYSEISESLTHLGLMVSRLAYAKKSVNRSDANSLQPLWEWLRAHES
jgi:Ca2+/Na+ antiporter